MKYLVGLCLFLFVSLSVQGDGIDFFHGTWDEAIAEAKAQDKILFVDAYAEWCGPCKRMARNVFTHDEVGKFYNANFINLKLDMEKSENKKFRQKYPVSAFPTLFYIDYTGEVVQKVKGAQQVDGFINLGKSALSKIDRSGEYAKEYEAGSREPELVYNYVKALNKAGKPSLKIANEYIRSQDNMDTPENMKFIWIATNEADSRIFNLLIENRKKIEAIVGEEKVNGQILKACENTAQKALEFESESLLDEAKDKMKKYYPEKANNFALNWDMEYCKAAGDCKDYLKAANAYAKKEVKGQPDELIDLAKDVQTSFPKDMKAQKLAENLAAQAVESGDTYKYSFTYANILYKNGKKSEALKAAKNSLSMAQAQNAKADIQRIQKFIEQLQS